MDDRELQEVLRGGLAVHAEDADTAAAVVERARADVGRRRRTRWTAVAAAAAVAVIAGGTAVARMGNEPLDTMELDRDRDPGVADGEWRTEYWADVAVDVPADWGYGGAPGDRGEACFDDAMFDARGEPLGSRKVIGWVGRPILVADVCASYPSSWEPTAPYVWLGAGVEPGIYEYDNGYVQETVAHGGSTVTVGTTDDELRRRILSSVTNNESPCSSTYDAPPRGMFGVTDTARPLDPMAVVCAYRGRRDEGYQLTYAARVNVADASAAIEAQRAAHEPTGRACTETYELLVLQGQSIEHDGSISRVVYDISCAEVDLGARVHTELVPEGVLPIASNGIPAVFYGPSGIGTMVDPFGT